MAYDENNFTKLKALKSLAERINTRLQSLETGGTALKAATLSGNQLKFYNSTDTTTTAAYTFDLPAEQFLDQASTNFVPNFTFSAETYAGADNPNLNGKPVMVLGVKTKSNDGTTETLNYSFLDVSALVDTYTASDTSIVITDNQIKANVSATEGNLLSTTANGLFVDGSGKADKITDGTANNLVAIDANGNIKDSGYTVATDAEVTEMLDEVLGAAS